VANHEKPRASSVMSSRRSRIAQGVGAGVPDPRAPRVVDVARDDALELAGGGGEEPSELRVPVRPALHVAPFGSLGRGLAGALTP
jgi:hypothetical protein